ncbi:MAG: FAD-dependent oxidoreductase, partial [Pseudomonadota bacterium]
MHPADTEAAVIVMGCGPAGAGAALWLARRGIDVIVLDRGDEPGTRIESLPPDGIRLADELGLAGAIDDSTLGAVAEMQLYWRDLPEIRSFDADRAPLLLSKPGFHAAVRQAVRDAGTRVFRRTIRSIAAGMDG